MEPKILKIVKVACLSLVCTVSLAAHAEDDFQQQDPWEGFNRKMFAFNMGLDRHILEPASLNS